MRWVVAVISVAGWLVLACAVATPLAAGVYSLFDASAVATQVVGSPTAAQLAKRSLVLSGVAVATALALGLVPAAILGSCSRRAWPWLVGLTLAPLIVPPQVYAYAWGLLGSNPQDAWQGGAIRAGAISGSWLWPVVGLVISAGWRSSGRSVYRLALLDASPLRAFTRAVLPSLRPAVLAAACLVGGITLVEYAIPHLTLCRVWSTELMVLVEVGAPQGQVLRMALQPIAAVAVCTLLAAWAVRTSGAWHIGGDEDTTFDRPERLNKGLRDQPGRLAWCGGAAVWLGTLGVPVGLMLANMRIPGAWLQGLAMFSSQWIDSLEVALLTAVASILVAIATVGWWRASGTRMHRWMAFATVAAAIIPPPVVGIGFILVFNRGGTIGDLYTQTPLVWMLALVARYGAVAVLIALLAGRRDPAVVDQARVDGGTPLDILSHVLLPLMWPSLAAAGLLVAVLAVFEVVVTQMVVPPAYGSVAMTILNYMHYGRDDAVIASSVTLLLAGMLITQGCAHLLSRAGK